LTTQQYYREEIIAGVVIIPAITDAPLAVGIVITLFSITYFITLIPMQPTQ
jgi:hypothetical protein